MTVFDADAYRAAREPFILVVKGRRHVARPVSAELVIALQRKLSSEDHAVVTAALKRLLRAAFPWKIWMWWRGDPVYHALYLDLGTRRALLADFFRFLGGDDRPAPPAMPGTTLPT